MSQMQTPADTPTDGHTARRLETRRRLLEAGTELFAEGGLTAVTSTAIARRAGVATGTFYLHFPDKHALFEELVQLALEEMRPQFSLSGAGRASEAEIRGELEHVLEVAERRRNLIRAVFDRGESTDLAGRIHDRIAKRMTPSFEHVFREKGIALNPTVAAQARAAVLVRLVAWWVEDPTRATRDEIIDTLMEYDPRRAPARSEERA